MEQAHSLRAPFIARSLTSIQNNHTKADIAELISIEEAIEQLNFDSERVFEDKFDRVTNISGHTKRVNCICFNADGSLFASGSWDKYIKIWKTSDRSQEFSFPEQPDSISSVSFSPDSSLFAAGSLKIVTIWNFHTKEIASIIEPHTDWVFSIAFSQNGVYLASCSQDSLVSLWSLKDNSLYFSFSGHKFKVNSIRFSPDSLKLVSGSSDKTIKVWNIENRILEYTSPIQSAGIFCVAFSLSGLYIASGSNMVIKLWSAQTNSEAFSLTGHKDWVNSLVFTSDSNYLISGSSDKTIKYWNLIEKCEEFSLTGHISSIVSLSSYKNLLLSSAEDSSIKFWDLGDIRPELTIVNASTVQSVDLSSDNKSIALGLCENDVKIISQSDSTLQLTLPSHSNWIFSVSFSPDGLYLASGSQDKTVKLWSTADYSLLTTFSGHTSRIFSICFTPDSKFVISGGEDKLIKIWGIEAKSEVGSLIGHTSKVWAVCASGDARYVVSGSGDFSVRLWDLEKKEEIVAMAGHKYAVYCVGFSCDSRLIASGGEDTSVRVWSVEERREAFVLTGHTLEVRAVTFNKNDRYLISGGCDRLIIVWNIDERRKEFVIDAHIGRVKCVVVNGLGQIFSSSDDKTLKMWNFKEFLYGTQEEIDQKFHKLEGAQKFLQYYNAVYTLGISAYNNLSKLSANIFITSKKFTPLHILCYKGVSTAVSSLLANPTASLSADTYGRSPLFYAIKARNQNCVDILLKHLISLSSNPDSSVFRASFYAIRNDLCEIILNSSKLLDMFLATCIKPSVDYTYFGQPVSSLPIVAMSASSLTSIPLFTRVGSTDTLPLKFQTLEFALPATSGSNESKLLFESILNCQNEDIYRTEFIQYLVQYKWNRLFFIICMYSTVLWTNLWLLAMMMSEYREDFFWVFAGVNVFLMLWEIVQFVQEGLVYLTSWWNAVDILMVTATLTWIVLHYFGLQFQEFTWTIVALNLIRGLTGFRAFAATRYYIQLVLKSLSSIKYFLLIFLYTTISLGLLQIAASDIPISFHSLWMNSFGLAVGETDNVEHSEFGLQYISFTIAVVLNVILMLNLIISILGDSFDEFQLKSEIYNYKEMVEVILEIEQILSLFRFAGKREYLHICTHAYDTQKGWKGKVMDSHEFMAKVEQRINSRLVQVEEKSGEAKTRQEQKGETTERKEDRERIRKIDLVIGGFNERIGNVEIEVKEVKAKLDRILKILAPGK